MKIISVVVLVGFLLTSCGFSNTSQVPRVSQNFFENGLVAPHAQATEVDPSDSDEGRGARTSLIVLSIISGLVTVAGVVVPLVMLKK